MPSFEFRVPEAPLSRIGLLLAGLWLASCCGCKPRSQPTQPEARAGSDSLTDMPSASRPPAVGASLPPESDGGASREASGQTAEQAPEQASAAIDFNVDERPWIDVDQLPWKLDYVQYLDGQLIGFSHIEVLPSAIGQREQIHVSRTDSIHTLLEGKRSRAEVKLEAIEKSSGLLQSFTVRTIRGESVATTQGTLRGSRLELKSTGDDPEQPAEESRKTLPYPAGTWGTLGVQSLLLREPMQPSEKRRTHVFIAALNEVAEVELAAGTPEITPLAGGRAPELLPIEIVMRTENSGMRSRNWTNERGEIEKTIVLSEPRITTFRVPRATTQRLESAARMEQAMNHRLPLAGDLEAVNELRDRVYLVHARAVDPFRLIPQTSRQQVRSLDPRAAEVTIRPADSTPRPREASAETTDQSADSPVDRPGDHDLQSNDWVPAQHAAVASLAEEILGERTQPSEAAERLTRGVFEKVRAREVDTDLGDVVKTARERVGDAVDQSLLLTALLRSQGIPARVVSGMLVKTSTESSLGFHMWTEAWVEERWISLDASRGEPAGARHIALHRDSLADENPYTAVLPALAAMQSITRVEVVTAGEK